MSRVSAGRAVIPRSRVGIPPEDGGQRRDGNDQEYDETGGEIGGGSAGDDIEDQQYGAGADGRDADQRQAQQHVSRLDGPELDVPPEQSAMQVDRRKAQRRRRYGREDQEQIGPVLKPGEGFELPLEGDGQQETGEDLGTGLGDSQLLQDVVPVAIHLFVERLVPAVRRVSITGPLARNARRTTL